MCSPLPMKYIDGSVLNKVCTVKCFETFETTNSRSNDINTANVGRSGVAAALSFY